MAAREPAAAPPPAEQAPPASPTAPLGGLLPGVAAAGAAAGGLAGVGAAGVLPAAVVASATRVVVRAMADFAAQQAVTDAEIIAATIGGHPDLGAEDQAALLSEERAFRREFVRKMLKRLRRDVPAALRLREPEARRARIEQIVQRERRVIGLRREAIRRRAFGRGVVRRLERTSPLGAVWVLGANVKQHTPDCVALARVGWIPMSILRRTHPPLHFACACRLVGLDDAVAQGLIRPDQVPAEGDALDVLRRVKAALALAHDVHEAVAPEVFDSWLEWLQEGERYAVRWEKGAVGAGQFRPRRGVPRQALRALRQLAPSYPKPPGLRGPESRSVTIKGRRVRVPRDRQFRRSIGGHEFASPSGSLNVYRDGKLVSEPGAAPSHPDLAVGGAPAAVLTRPADAGPDLARTVRGWQDNALGDTLQDGTAAVLTALLGEHGRDAAKVRATLLGLGFEEQHHDYYSADQGWQIFRDPAGFVVSLRVADGQVSSDVKVHPGAWKPSEADAQRIGGWPEDFHAVVADVFATVAGIARDLDVPMQHGQLSTSERSDHTGIHSYAGNIDVAAQAERDIEAALAARAAGRPVNAAAVYASYHVLSHEWLHAVKPIGWFHYDTQAGLALEEALVEELAHGITSWVLRDHGFGAEADWALAHPAHVASGVYTHHRAALAGLFDRAQIRPDHREEALWQLKAASHSERFQMIQDATGMSETDVVLHLANPEGQGFSPMVGPTRRVDEGPRPRFEAAGRRVDAGSRVVVDEPGRPVTVVDAQRIGDTTWFRAKEDPAKRGDYLHMLAHHVVSVEDPPGGFPDAPDGFEVPLVGWPVASLAYGATVEFGGGHDGQLATGVFEQPWVHLPRGASGTPIRVRLEDGRRVWLTPHRVGGVLRVTKGAAHWRAVLAGNEMALAQSVVEAAGFERLHPRGRAGKFVNAWRDPKPAWEPPPGVEAPSPEMTAYLSSHRAAKDVWNASIRRAMSVGEVSHEAAKERGYREPAKGDGWMPLPSRLWHVTTAASAVREHGLRSRDELGQAQGVGLGGGEGDTVSFTTDPEVAHGIESALRLMRSVQRGEFALAEMERQAKTGERANRPWWSDVEGSLTFELEQLRTGRVKRRNLLGVSQEDAAAEWWPDAPLDQVRPEAPMLGSTQKAMHWSGPLSETQRRDALTKVLRYWLAYREQAGGPTDPLFAFSDFEALGRVAESEIATLEFRPKPGAMGYRMGALGEWRTASGEAVDLVLPVAEAADWRDVLHPRDRLGRFRDVVRALVPAHRAAAKVRTSPGEGRIPTRHGVPVAGQMGTRDLWAKKARMAGLSSAAAARKRTQEWVSRMVGPESGAQVMVRQRPEAFGWMLAHGRAPNGHETPDWHDRGDSYLSSRAEQEREWFGIPRSAPPEAYPVYGYMGVPGEEAVARNPVGGFGKIRLVLRPEVRQRTTFTYSDSLYVSNLEGGGVVPSPVDNPSELSVSANHGADWLHTQHATFPVEPQRSPEPPLSAAEKRDLAAARKTLWAEQPPDYRMHRLMGDEAEAYWREKRLQRLEGEGRYSFWTHGDFFEAQIHGAVTLADVVHVDFPEPPLPEWVRALADHGISWSALGISQRAVLEAAGGEPAPVEPVEPNFDVVTIEGEPVAPDGDRWWERPLEEADWRAVLHPRDRGGRFSRVWRMHAVAAPDRPEARITTRLGSAPRLQHRGLVSVMEVWKGDRVEGLSGRVKDAVLIDHLSPDTETPPILDRYATFGDIPGGGYISPRRGGQHVVIVSDTGEALVQPSHLGVRVNPLGEQQSVPVAQSDAGSDVLARAERGLSQSVDAVMVMRRGMEGVRAATSAHRWPASKKELLFFAGDLSGHQGQLELTFDGTDPSMLWVAPYPAVAGAMVHELGHALDERLGRTAYDELFGGERHRESGDMRPLMVASEQWDKALGESSMTDAQRAAWRGFFVAAHTPDMRERVAAARQPDYAGSRSELWARAYTQWVALARDGEVLSALEQMEGTAPEPGQYEHHASTSIPQWGAHEWPAVGAALEGVLRSYGLVGDVPRSIERTTIPESMLVGYRKQFGGDPVRFAVMGGEGTSAHPYFADQPGVAAFLDVFVSDGEVQIGYVTTDTPHRRRGLAEELIRHVYDAFPEKRVRWGRVMDDSVERMRQRFRAEYPARTA